METVSDAVTYVPIGVIRSPWKSGEGAPIQPSGARGVRGTVELRPGYEPALADLDGFSHVILVYHCDRVASAPLRVVPFLDSTPHGVFATRSPARPNPIGLSVVRVVAVRDSAVEIEDVDALDGTPVLDLKPFVPEFDLPAGEIRVGWLAGKLEDGAARRGDARFQR